MNDDFLTRLRRPPRPEFAAALYERISTPMNTQPKFQTWRTLSLSLGALVALAALILVVTPSARAFAEGVIRQIGGYAFTQDPFDAAKGPSSVGFVRTGDTVSVQIAKGVPSASSPAEASSLAGFTVLAPSYLPAGYSAMSGWIVATESNGTVVTIAYKDGANNFFAINQLKVGAGDPAQTYHRDQIVDVKVRGHDGVWLPDPASPNGKNALVWEENGVTYSIIGNSLALGEMLKVAQSLGQ